MPARCCCIIPLRGGVVISGVIMLVISLALLAATFTHRNPMIIHLSITHVVLPWIYIGFMAATAVVSLFVILSGLVAKLNLMRLTKFLLWFLVFLLTIWEAICFILSLTNRSKSLSACEEANPSSSNNTTTANNATVTIGGYSTTFLGMQPGHTYGLANCGQAIQADVIGSAIILFVGQLLMFYAATVVGSFTAKLRERKLGHRLRDLEWDDNLDELASTYRTDASNAPRYPLNDLGKKKKGFLKNLKFGK
ncbi:hypothetical protein BDF20DRAFT_910159 [Mycotypha africana]|uniref:uncharacterized protein n=1 Tax=Mycotypha africana TaxID=64632 RepID=UPI0022FFCA67|nr:uncharacterized protein BDF20DRAFT_910159 [Mycotypha africana]KAI8987570.1 hypothetical protein BDF20DRAFT_910159 [Mycotypha africana]